jgi:trehalose 6-phosphate phosphatase
MARQIGDLPHALEDSDQLVRDLADRLPAVFLDYDGSLTPIVDRPEDTLISESMREAAQGLAGRHPAGVVSGRERWVVQELTGVDDLFVAGSHGFDIWSPAGGEIRREEGAGFADLIENVNRRLHREMDPIEGALTLIEKKTSVAAPYRLVSEDERPRIKEIVAAVLEENPDDLKVTPSKMVYEIQPNGEWDRGKATLYPLGGLCLDRGDVMPMYLGDDLTDEYAFEALAGLS